MEAAIWCETITDRGELEFLLLPRLGGLAEKAWGVPGATGTGTRPIRLNGVSRCGMQGRNTEMTVNDVRFPYEDASLPIDSQYEEVRFGFNKSVLTGLLCDQLRFDGTVCTDWGLITDN